MKVLYGTRNPAKIEAMKRITRGLDLEIIGINELNCAVPHIDEEGKNPLENAEIKARTYYSAFNMPVFSCDSGLYFENIEERLQPGTQVRRINGKNLSDDEMIEYYSQLSREKGGLIGRYKNAVCFIADDNHIFKSMDNSLSGDKFIIGDIPHQKRIKGFPLDSLSIDIKTGKYYFDLDEPSAESTIDAGFRAFWENALKSLD